MYKKSFNEYMNETKTVNRWFILKIALIGGLASALLTVIIMLSGFVLK